MNLENIRELSDNELGKTLTDRLSLDTRPYFDRIAYEVICKDLNVISKVEEIVIAKTSLTDYGRCLVGATECHGIGLEATAIIATADARTRACACLLALQENL